MSNFTEQEHKSMKLAFKIANSAARYDIETRCKLRNDDGSEPNSSIEEQRSCWYDTSAPNHSEDAPYISDATEYLALRNLLKRHPTKPHWVRVLDDDA